MEAHDIVRCDLFNGVVTAFQTKKDVGSFHPKREDFPAQMELLYGLIDRREVFAPRLAFTNLLVNCDNAFPLWGNEVRFDDSASVVLDPGVSMLREQIAGFYRSRTTADAGMSHRLPIVMFNADCPVGVFLFQPYGTQGVYSVAVLHLGLMTMISKDGRRSLVDVVLDFAQMHDLRVAGFWMGFGARPCCYGLHDEDDRWPLISRYQGVNRESVLYGPRKGQRAVDLYAIAHAQIRERVDVNLIQFHDNCTVCNGGDSVLNDYHFSNLMGCDKLERNAVIVKLNG